MTDVPDSGGDGQPSIQDQLVRAARDLWSSVVESGEDYVMFMDRRRLTTAVRLGADGLYHVSWEMDDGRWVDYERAFESLRQAAFHGYQGPH